ncbi:hypothetical protein FOZ63_008684, partial [Perkinsus olseni]
PVAGGKVLRRGKRGMHSGTTELNGELERNDGSEVGARITEIAWRRPPLRRYMGNETTLQSVGGLPALASRKVLWSNNSANPSTAFGRRVSEIIGAASGTRSLWSARYFFVLSLLMSSSSSSSPPTSPVAATPKSFGYGARGNPRTPGAVMGMEAKLAEALDNEWKRTEECREKGKEIERLCRRSFLVKELEGELERDRLLGGVGGDGDDAKDMMREIRSLEEQ